MTSIEPTKTAKPRRLMRSLGLAGVAAVALGLMSASPALADDWHHGRGHGHDGWRGPHPVYYAHPRPRVYYAPPPVYYAPRPRVYYAPPPPVYYAPPPVYYAPPGISLVIPLHIR
jgi:hypothetical protein